MSTDLDQDARTGRVLRKGDPQHRGPGLPPFDGFPHRRHRQYLRHRHGLVQEGPVQPEIPVERDAPQGGGKDHRDVLEDRIHRGHLVKADLLQIRRRNGIAHLYLLKYSCRLTETVAVCTFPFRE